MTDRTGDPPTGRESPVELITSEAATTDDAVDALCNLAASDADRVDRPLDDVASLLADGGPDATLDERTTAIAVVGRFGTRCPGYASRIVSLLSARLDDPALETTTLRALAHVAGTEPSAVDPCLDAVGRRLTGEPVPTRRSALRVLEARAEAEPAAVSSFSPQLVSAVVETTGRESSDPELPDHQRTRRYGERVAEDRLGRRTAALLADVASTNPTAVAPHLDQLGQALDPGSDRTVHVRERVLDVVSLVAERAPDAALDARDPLMATVTSGDAPPALRADAARTLATLADAHFEATTEPTRSAVPALGDLLAEEDPTVRANAAALLSYVAQRYPDEVATQTGTLVDRLADDHDAVRAGVVWTLAYVDTAQARDALADAAETDPDPEIRALAAELHPGGPDE